MRMLRLLGLCGSKYRSGESLGAPGACLLGNSRFFDRSEDGSLGKNEWPIEGVVVIVKRREVFGCALGREVRAESSI